MLVLFLPLLCFARAFVSLSAALAAGRGRGGVLCLPRPPQGGGTPPRGCQHHAAEIRESKGLISKRSKKHLPVVGSRIRHQISTSHMCFRADGHISVSERPQTRDFHRNRHPKMPIFGACGAQNRHPTGARRRCRPQPTPKFSVKIPMTILPYTKFRDLTWASADTPEGECRPLDASVVMLEYCKQYVLAPMGRHLSKLSLCSTP